MPKINKIDAMRRQLLAAIHMRWYLEEPIAAYHLAANAWEIANTLLKREDRLRMAKQIEITHGPGFKLWELINGPRNFVKHASQDPDAEIEDISGKDCDEIIEIACVDYTVLIRRAPFIFGLYMTWYSAIYPNKTGVFLRAEANEAFPGLSEATELEQLVAARAAAFGWERSGDVAHSKNELTDNWRWVKLRKAFSL